MALLAIEGFDHYGVNADMVRRVGMLQWVSAGGLTAGRGGVGQAIRLAWAEDPQSGVLGGNFGTVFYGFWMMGDPGTQLTFTIGESVGGRQGYFVFDCTYGRVAYYNNAGTLLLMTTNGMFNSSVGVVVEIEFTVNATNGVAVVRLMGQPVLSLSGINTQATSLSYQNTFSLSWAGPIGTTLTIDDWRMCDDTVGPGTYPCNGFLGDVRVATSFASSNAAVQFTPLSNTNYVEVEGVFHGDGAYNYPTALGQSDLFGVDALPSSVSLVMGVQVTGAYRATDSAPHTMTNNIKVGATLHQGGTIALGTTYGFYPDLYPVSPISGVSWTPADLASTKIGYTAVS